MDAMRKVERYKDIIESILGRSLNDSRHREDVAGRMCIAYQLIQDGYSTIEAGRQIGRDHATVLHYRKSMENCKAFPKAYRYECDLWEQFQSMLNQNENNNENEIYG